MGKTYYVYILASVSRVLYVGMTSKIRTRTRQHKEKQVKGFTARYNVSRLMYYEVYGDVFTAIEREKQIKRWRREKKIALIEKENSDWVDLSEGWYS